MSRRSHEGQDSFAPRSKTIRAADQREELPVEQSRFLSEVSCWRRLIAEAELSEMRRCFARLGYGGATRPGTGRTAVTTSETADRTQTQGSVSNGLMRESGVNRDSGSGGNATGTIRTTGVTKARTGSSGAVGGTGR
jgi:hypothetical protein